MKRKSSSTRFIESYNHEYIVCHSEWPYQLANTQYVAYLIAGSLTSNSWIPITWLVKINKWISRYKGPTPSAFLFEDATVKEFVLLTFSFVSSTQRYLTVGKGEVLFARRPKHWISFQSQNVLSIARGRVL